MTATYGYDADSKTCRLYNRDEDNAVGFETRKLDLYEGNRLAHFMDRLYNAGVRHGQEELAHKIRSALPPHNGDG